MADIISLAQFKEHARILHNDEDDSIESMIAAANSFVIGYLPEPEDENWTPPADLIQAALLIVAHWFENRESATSFSLMDIPIGANDIIANYREWSF